MVLVVPFVNNVNARLEVGQKKKNGCGMENGLEWRACSTLQSKASAAAAFPFPATNASGNNVGLLFGAEANIKKWPKKAK